MKNYNELIKWLEEFYNKKLEVKIIETEKEKCIYIYGIMLINSSILKRFKDYCNNFYITANNDFEISIGLIINKN